MENDEAVTSPRFDNAEEFTKAYRALEEELTRRNEKIEALERAVKEARTAREQELELMRSVPLMTGGGAGVSAPPVRARSFDEAGKLALGYFKKSN